MPITQPVSPSMQRVLEQLATIFDARLVEEWEQPLPPAAAATTSDLVPAPARAAAAGRPASRRAASAA